MADYQPWRGARLIRAGDALDSHYDIEALQFATAREAFDYCDGPHEGCGGDGVAMQWVENGQSRYVVIARADARRLESRGDRLIHLRKVPLMKGDGDVVCGFTSMRVDPDASHAAGDGSPTR